MRIFITGGAGFIGSHLVEAHIARGDDVAVLDDLSTGRRENIEKHIGNPRFEFRQGSVLTENLVRSGASGADRIYHLAAAVGVEYIIKNPLHSLNVNLLGTERALETAAISKTPIFIASTSEVYGKSEKLPFSEDDDRLMGSTSISRWGYANSKAIDEFLALAYFREMGLPVIIGRFFNTVGPRQSDRYGMVLPRFVSAALKGEDILVYGTGEQTRCFMDVSDVVRFVLALFEKPECVGRVFNLGSTERISINDLAARVIRITGTRSKVRHMRYEEAFNEGFEDMMHRAPDMTRFESATGLKPAHDLDAIIRRVTEYYRR